MSWIAVGVGAATQLYGASQSSGAAKDAAKQQQEAAQGALNLQRQTLDQAERSLAPYLSIGNKSNALLGLGLGVDTGATAARQIAINYLRDKYNTSPNWVPEDALLESTVNSLFPEGTDKIAGISSGSLTRDFTADDLKNDVVYNNGLEFGLNEGTKALERRQLASGMYDSGSALKDLTRFANDYGTTKTGEAQQRFVQGQDRTYTKLAGQQGVGMGAVGTMTGLGANAAGNMGNLMTQQGNAGAAGTVAGANAWSNAFGNIGNAFQQNRLLEALSGGGQRSGVSNYGGAGMDPFSTGMSDMYRSLYGS